MRWGWGGGRWGGGGGCNGSCPCIECRPSFFLLFLFSFLFFPFAAVDLVTIFHCQLKYPLFETDHSKQKTLGNFFFFCCRFGNYFSLPIKVPTVGNRPLKTEDVFAAVDVITVFLISRVPSVGNRPLKTEDVGQYSS